MLDRCAQLKLLLVNISQQHERQRRLFVKDRDHDLKALAEFALAECDGLDLVDRKQLFLEFDVIELLIDSVLEDALPCAVMMKQHQLPYPKPVLQDVLVK